MRLKLKYILLLLFLAAFAFGKRSGGRSRGSSSSSSGWSTFWNRKNSKSESARPVASAPKEPEIKKQTSNVQQNSRPIGWDVDNTKKQANPSQAVQQNSRPIGWDVDNNKKQVNPSQAQPPSYQQSAPANPPSYQQSAPAYPPSYQQSAPAYPPSYHQNAPAYPPSYQQGGYPVHPPGYQQNAGGYPVHPPSYQQSMGAYPQQQYGGYGGGYPPQQPGMMGSFFGGKKPGFGGGYGGVGSYAAYNYGVKKSGGFFGKHAFRNVLGGLFVWYLVSGLVSRPYKVYNYYNQPRERQEITLPANILTLCNENATNICMPGTTGICTQDNKILCVTTMATASPCQDKPGELCVTSTIPCLDSNDPLCKNKTTPENATTVNLPCFTNMTIEPALAPAAPNVTLPVLPANSGNKYCVTTMAVPDPELPTENVQSLDTALPGNGTSTEGSNSTILNKQ